MQTVLNGIVRVVADRRSVGVVIGLSALAIFGAFHAVDVARRAAEADAAWVRQRLAEKRALVRSLQADLAAVAETTERVSQMASIAREHNAEVRRLAQLEDAGQTPYTPARLAALDDATFHRSDEGARAIAQLAFLEEQLAETTDSLSLMTALSRGMRPADEPAPSAAPRPRPQRAAVTPAVARAVVPTEGIAGTWPVAGEISSRFGWRESPWGRGTRRHTGLDIIAQYGTPVRTSAGGMIVFAGRDSGGYGTTVVVDHGRNVKTLYGHLSGIYVREGDRVRAGTATSEVAGL